MSKAVVTFTPANIDACALWRFFYPHLNIADSRFMFTGGMPSINELSESDIVCCQRMMTDQNLKFLQAMRSYGMRIVYDLDDNVWDIPKTNPAAYIFNTPQVRNGMAACAEWADVLTVSTQTLKKVVLKQWGHLRNVATKKEIPIIVYENRVDPAFFNPQERNGEFITIGWAGSNTHAGDLYDIWPVLYRILEKYPQVRVELVGHQAPFTHERLKHREWVAIADYSFAISSWNWDIFLAPLEDHKFNYSKSSIKMIEAGILARPCLGGYVRPYADFCKQDKELEYQLCTIPMQWERKLTELIEDQDHAVALGNKMRSHVLEHFHIRDTAKMWREIVGKAMEDYA